MSEKITSHKKAPGIYLYGAGGLGKEFYQKLVDVGFDNLKGFLDTFRSDAAGAPLPVYQIDQYLESNPSSGNIIIIASDFFREIKFELDRRNIKTNVYSIGEFVTTYFVELIDVDINVFKGNKVHHEYFAGLTNYFVSRVMGWAHDPVFWGDRLLTLDKSNGFLSDERFRRAFEAVRGAHIYDQYSGEHTISYRLNTLIWAARNALSLDGDFVECGVFNGDMSWVVVNTTDFHLSKKSFYLYDSFEGFSEKHSSSADFPENPWFFEFAQKVYQKISYDAVVERFLEWPTVKAIRGFLPESLEIASPERIAYLHIDLNSPAAEIGVLEHLFDRVVPGGYVIFDDYGWSFFHRQKEAEDEFMAKRGYSILELPTGQGLVIKR